MAFKGTITSEMQLEWFNKINNNHNYFFIAMYNEDEIGINKFKRY